MPRQVPGPMSLRLSVEPLREFDQVACLRFVSVSKACCSVDGLGPVRATPNGSMTEAESVLGTGRGKLPYEAPESDDLSAPGGVSKEEVRELNGA